MPNSPYPRIHPIEQAKDTLRARERCPLTEAFSRLPVQAIGATQLKAQLHESDERHVTRRLNEARLRRQYHRLAKATDTTRSKPCGEAPAPHTLSSRTSVLMTHDDLRLDTNGVKLSQRKSPQHDSVGSAALKAEPAYHQGRGNRVTRRPSPTLECEVTGIQHRPVISYRFVCDST